MHISNSACCLLGVYPMNHLTQLNLTQPRSQDLLGCVLAQSPYWTPHLLVIPTPLPGSYLSTWVLPSYLFPTPLPGSCLPTWFLLSYLTLVCLYNLNISEEALQYDADRIGLLFLNSPLRDENLKGEDELQKILNNVSASGGTPTGARLDAVLGDYIRKLDAAVNTPAYGAIKPLDLIVIADGEPTDDPKPVLEKWAGHLDARKHHPNIVGIQFVQIGDVASATAALIELTKGKVRIMVDTVPYNGNFAPEKLAQVLLGAVMPSIRAKQNARLP
ncbi:phospholipase [Ceratobasidium sp. AG-Ba]|nr:phospholipase [Ceratobasidium sp. AG-Ba]